MLHGLGADARAVRLPEELATVGGLIIPGGESTTIGLIAEHYALLDAIRERAHSGMPVWGTCAGMILLAKTITRSRRGGQPVLGLMDITVQRNAFGRQVDSFEADVQMAGLDEVPFHCVFIRAPLIESVGAGVRVLARLPETGEIIAAQEGRLLVTSFHPELTSDARVHEYFLSLDERA